MEGVLLSKAKPDTLVNFGEYDLTFKNDYTLSWTPGARTENWPLASALVIKTGPNEFYIAGTGTVVTFKHHTQKDLRVGLLKVDEGHFEGQKWIVDRHLNGDQTHQGRHVSIPTGAYAIQRVKLYTYE